VTLNLSVMMENQWLLRLLQSGPRLYMEPRVPPSLHPGCVSDLKAVSARRALGTQPRL